VDVVTHAVVGFVYGGPMGFIGSVIPDLPLFGPRRSEPSGVYVLMHSVLFTALLFAVHPGLGLGHLTHMALDIPTHRSEFGIRPFWPISDWVWKGVGEWEWGNTAWWVGMFVAIWWIGVKVAWSSLFNST